MGILLDRGQSSTTGLVLASFGPNDNTDSVILHLYSTFDDYDTEVSVTNVETKGSWIEFTMTQAQVPNRSGRYRIELHTGQRSTVSLDTYMTPFDATTSPLDDIAQFVKDALLATTVGDIVNATNELFKSHTRNIEYKDQERTRTFKSQTREVDYKTKF